MLCSETRNTRTLIGNGGSSQSRGKPLGEGHPILVGVVPIWGLRKCGRAGTRYTVSGISVHVVQVTRATGTLITVNPLSGFAII